MKIKTTQIVEAETELQLPFFYKTDNMSVAVISESKYAIIYYGDSIVQLNGSPDIPSNYQQITAEEFTAGYDKVLEQLGQIKSQFFAS